MYEWGEPHFWAQRYDGDKTFLWPYMRGGGRYILRSRSTVTKRRFLSLITREAVYSLERSSRSGVKRFPEKQRVRDGVT